MCLSHCNYLFHTLICAGKEYASFFQYRDPHHKDPSLCWCEGLSDNLHERWAGWHWDWNWIPQTWETELVPASTSGYLKFSLPPPIDDEWTFMLRCSLTRIFLIRNVQFFRTVNLGGSSFVFSLVKKPFSNSLCGFTKSVASRSKSKKVLLLVGRMISFFSLFSDVLAFGFMLSSVRFHFLEVNSIRSSCIIGQRVASF
jgi:hypothetical protein